MTSRSARVVYIEWRFPEAYRRARLVQSGQSGGIIEI